MRTLATMINLNACWNTAMRSWHLVPEITHSTFQNIIVHWVFSSSRVSRPLALLLCSFLLILWCHNSINIDHNSNLGSSEQNSTPPLVTEQAMSLWRGKPFTQCWFNLTLTKGQFTIQWNLGIRDTQRTVQNCPEF